jgi:predicted AAA+ superfamily ATPase
MKKGGLPVPMFLRDDESRRLYWDGWLETTLIRDLARAYGKGYDLDFSRLVLKEIGSQLLLGNYPEISGFTKDSRKVSKYLKAMEAIFLVNRIPCHESGVGRDHWLLGDSGLAAHLLGVLGAKLGSEAVTLSLARHCLYNEIAANHEYRLKRAQISYYKSARGEPIDFLVNNLPVKLVVQSSGPMGWHKKGLLGAMKKLRSDQGFLIAPIEKSDTLKKRGISRVSWLHFSR